MCSIEWYKTYCINDFVKTMMVFENSANRFFKLMLIIFKEQGKFMEI